MKNFEFDESVFELGSAELIIEPVPFHHYWLEKDPELRKLKMKACVDRMLSRNEEQFAKSKEGAETT